MIILDGKEIALNKFPDGTLLLKESIQPYIDNDCREARIVWHFENNEEMIAIMFLARHLQSNGVVFVHLVMPYIPNARQDRVKTNEDVFTLKYFAEFINSLGFNSVTVLDPHSSVSEALIDNLIIESPERFIQRAINDVYTRYLNAQKSQEKAEIIDTNIIEHEGAEYKSTLKDNKKEDKFKELW